MESKIKIEKGKDNQDFPQRSQIIQQYLEV